MSNTFYVPVEMFSREYSAKLALATFLAGKGMRVVFGHKWYVKTAAMTNGRKGDFYLHNHGFTIEMKHEFQHLFDKGMHFVGYQDEGVYDFENYSDLVKVRNQIEGFSNYKIWLCWGKRDFHYLKNALSDSSNLRNIGTPRSALWGNFGNSIFKNEISKDIIPKYGDFYLIATSFEHKYLVKHSKAIHALNSIFENYPKELLSERENPSIDNLNTLKSVKLLKLLLTETKLNIVIRPHAVEVKSIINTLKSFGVYSDRIFIDRRLTITPLISASKAVFHFGSTVGVEALCLGRKSVSLENFDHAPSKSVKLSSLLSLTPCDNSDILRYLNPSFRSSSDLNYLITDPGNEYFYTNLAKDIEKIEPNAFKSEFPVEKFIMQRRPLKYRLKTALRSGKIYKYDLLKRPRLKYKYVVQLFKSISSILDLNPNNILWQTIERDTYLLERYH
jgi:surface carbohydrate biosynthesis protein